MNKVSKKQRKKLKKAVALAYDDTMTAPTVVATGSGKVAEHIIEEAEKNKVPVYKDEKLATLLTQLELGDMIPPELYETVARILVFVGDMDELYAKTHGQQPKNRSLL